MKKLINLFIIIPVVLLTALGYSSCQKTSLDAPVSTVTFRPASDFLKNNYEFTLFYAAIKRAGLVDSLNGPGPFTIFAPDDNAFNLRGIHSAADFDKMNADSLRFQLKYHILNRKLFISDVPKALDNLYANADGLQLYLSKQLAGGGTDLSVNGVSVSKSNVIVSNGIIHVLQNVLKYNPITVQDYLAANKDLSYFVAGLKKFNLWDSLKTTGPYTIVAPTNEAFIKNGITLDTINNLQTANYNPFLFKVYVLHPHHIFLSDGWNIGGNNGVSVTDGNYQLSISQFFGGQFALPLNQQTTYRVGLSDPDKGRDIVTTNGIVDLIADLLYFPADARK